MQVEQVTDPVAYHGEGPVWSARWGGLRWVDMLAGDVLALADDGTVSRRHVAQVVAALRPRRRGGAGGRAGRGLGGTFEGGGRVAFPRRRPARRGRRGPGAEGDRLHLRWPA